METPPPPPDELDEPEIIPAGRHTRGREARGWLERGWDLLFPSAIAAPAEGMHVRLSWKPVAGVRRYRIQVARERSFKTILSEAESGAPEWMWNYRPGMENSRGRVFFRVASVSEKGVVGAFSKAKPISIPATAAAGAAETARPVLTPVPILALREGMKGVTESTAGLPPARALPALRGMFSLDTGLGGMSQSSGEANLATVKAGPFFQQKLSAWAETHRGGGWAAGLEAAFASYGAPDSSRPTLQPDFSAFRARFDLLRPMWPAARAGGWNLSCGGALDRSYRWVKSGPQSVEAQGALSLGPSARVVRSYPYSGFLSPSEAGAALALPLSGLLSGGHAGLQGRIWGEWNLARLGERSALGAKAEAESAYLRWSAPTGTTTFAWTAWIAPVLRF